MVYLILTIHIGLNESMIMIIWFHHHFIITCLFSVYQSKYHVYTMFLF